MFQDTRLATCKTALRLLIGSCAFVGGCANLPDDATEQLRQANHAYQRAQYDKAERLTGDVIRSNPRHHGTAEAFYVRGLSRLQLERTAAAEVDFHEALQRCRRPELRALVSIQLGHLAYEAGDYARASEHYRPSISTAATSIATDEVWFRYGVSLQRCGQFGPARNALRQVLSRFPRSPRAKEALTKLDWKDNYFTVQCGAFKVVDTARKLMNRLHELGMQPTLNTVVIGGDTLHRVQVGRYPDFAAAMAALPRIHRVEADAFVLP